MCLSLKANLTLLSTMTTLTVSLSSLASFGAGFVTPYADYYPQHTIVYMEYDAENNAGKQILDDFMKHPFFVKMMSGDLSELEKSLNEASKDASTSTGTPQTKAMLDNYTQMAVALNKVTAEFYSKFLTHFESSFAIGIWNNEWKSTLDGTKKTSKKVAQKNEKGHNEKRSNDTADILIAVTLKEGVTLEKVISDLELDKPEVLPYKTKALGKQPASNIPVYFYRSKTGSKPGIYFYQQEQSVFITTSLAGVQVSVDAKRSGNRLATQADVSKALAFLAEQREGSFALHIPSEMKQLMKEFISLQKVALLTGDQTEETPSQVMALEKGMQLLDLSSVAVGGYHLKADPVAPKTYQTSFDFYVPLQWQAVKDVPLRNDLMVMANTRGKTPFADVLPEDIVASAGAYNLAAWYDLYEKHIMQNSPSQKKNLEETNETLSVMGLDFRKSIIGLFDDLAAICVSSIVLEKDQYDAASFLTSTADTLNLKDRAIAFIQIDKKIGDYYAQKTTPSGKKLDIMTMPYREHGVKKTLNFALTQPKPSVIALGTESMINKLPGVAAIKPLSQNSLFQQLSQGLPKTPLHYLYVDYFQFFENLKQNAPTLPSYFTSFYGRGTNYLVEGYYDAPKSAYTMQGRMQIVLGDAEEATVAKAPAEGAR